MLSEPETGEVVACYLHPGRPALTRCSRCERPICGDDLIEAPVGYQCPECARGGQHVRTMRDVTVARLTRALVLIIAVAFVVLTNMPDWWSDAALVPGRVGQGEVWRIVTSAFVHANLLHVGFNGYLLWMLGHQLEPWLGLPRYAVLYLGGLAGGALGVVALSYLTVVTPLASIPVLGQVFATHPFAPTVGASGAVFGLMGAAMVGLRNRGINPWRTDIGSLVLLNLVLTFVIGFISVGGHLGGLAGGALVGSLLLRDRERSSLVRAVLVTVAMFAVTVVLAYRMF